MAGPVHLDKADQLGQWATPSVRLEVPTAPPDRATGKQYDVALDIAVNDRQTWQHKPILREVYHDFYARIAGQLTDISGPTIEFGSGPGTLKSALPNVITTSCASGACVINTCVAGYENCDGSSANGCEINTQTSGGNCGACVVRTCVAW